MSTIEVPACHLEAGKTGESEVTPVSQGWKYKVNPLECHSGP